MKKDKMMPIRWATEDWEKIIVPAADRLGMSPSNFVRATAKAQAVEILNRGKNGKGK